MTNTENVRPPLAAYEDLARKVDFACLDADASEERVAQDSEIAKRHGVGRFTVRPCDLDLVSMWMQGTGIVVGTTVSWPHGSDTTAVRLYAVRDALHRGAKAVETVLNPGKMVSRQFRYVESELIQMAQECHRGGAELIVDLDLRWMREDLRVIACKLARRSEVDWVRCASESASLDDLRFLSARLGDLVRLDAGPSCQSLEEAQAAYEAGASGFQSTRPGPLLEAWTAELKRRAEVEAAVKSETKPIQTT